MTDTPAARCSSPGGRDSWSRPNSPGIRFRISAVLSTPLMPAVIGSARPVQVPEIDVRDRHQTAIPTIGGSPKTTAPAIRWMVDEVPAGVPGRLVGNTATRTSATDHTSSSIRTAVPTGPRAMARPASASAPVASANSGPPPGVSTT